MLHQKERSKSSRIFLQALVKRVGFWSNGLYDFVDHGDSIGLTPTQNLNLRKWIVVVSRADYFESTKDYPIASNRDVLKALKNEPWRFPYDGVHFFRVSRLSDTTHRVTSWVIKKQWIDKLPQEPLFMIPESACIEALDHPSVVSLTRLGESLYVAKRADGLKSSLGDQQPFLSDLGMQDDLSTEGISEKVESLSGATAVNTILLGVFKILRTSPLRFFLGVSQKLGSALPWESALKLSGFLGALYFGATSIYLHSVDFWLERKLQALHDQTQSSLQLRADLESYRAKLADVEAIFINIHPVWMAWDILLDLKSIGVTFRAVNSDGDAVTFFANASKASDILGLLSNYPRVEKADFTMPTKLVMGQEQFAIKVTFQSPEPMPVIETSTTTINGVNSDRDMDSAMQVNASDRALLR